MRRPLLMYVIFVVAVICDVKWSTIMLFVTLLQVINLIYIHMNEQNMCEQHEWQ